jgi:uncharacterized protein
MAGDTLGKVANWLVLIGALNWGLAGVGGFVNTNLNVVNLAVGSISVVENAVYLLVGLSALWVLKGQLGK